MRKRSLNPNPTGLSGLAFAVCASTSVLAVPYSFNENFSAPPLTPGTEPGSFYEDGFKTGDNGWLLVENGSIAPGFLAGGTNFGQRPVSFWPHGDDTQVCQVRQRPGTANAFAIRNLPSPLGSGNVTMMLAGYSNIGDIDFSLRLADATGATNALKLDFGCPQLGTDINDFFRARQDDGGSGVVVADANTQTTDNKPLKWNITAFTTGTGDYALLSVDFNTATSLASVVITTVDASGTHRSTAPVSLSLDPSVAAIERISLSANESPATPVNGSLAYIGNFSITGETVSLPSQWAVDSDGNWSTASNWTGGVPNSVGATASFGTIITSARTVTVDAPQTVGTINFSSSSAYQLVGSNAITLDVSSGQAAINVTAGAHTIAASVTLNKDTTITSAASTGVALTGTLNATGRNLAKAGTGTAQFENIRSASFNVTEGAAKISSKGSSNSATGTSVVGALTIAAGAQLDLTNNSLVIDYTTVGTVVTDLRQHLSSGRLTSTSAGAGKAIGYGDNAVLGKGSFSGQSVDATSALVMFTWAGDANLDGKVNTLDFNRLAGAFGSVSAEWTQGDFNYDGVVDSTDFAALAATYGMISPPAAPSLGSMVPEPFCVSMIPMMCFLLKRSSRRLS